MAFMSAMPNVVATLRSVEPVYRSLALGIESIITRLLGTIPGPFIVGSIIDFSCVKWSTQECSDALGSCLVYDNYKMALYMLLSILTVKVLGLIAFSLALFFSKRSHIKDDHHLEDEE